MYRNFPREIQTSNFALSSSPNGWTPTLSARGHQQGVAGLYTNACCWLVDFSSEKWDHNLAGGYQIWGHFSNFSTVLGAGNFFLNLRFSPGLYSLNKFTKMYKIPFDIAFEFGAVGDFEFRTFSDASDWLVCTASLGVRNQFVIAALIHSCIVNLVLAATWSWLSN